MANADNLKAPADMTAEERRQRASEMGKASGAARRRKADLRKAMNTILSGEAPMQIDGRDCTYAEAICFSLVRDVLKGRNSVPAFRAIMDTVGQTTATDLDIKEQKARIKAMEDQTDAGSAADDGFLDALNAHAAEDWTDEADAL